MEGEGFAGEQGDESEGSSWVGWEAEGVWRGGEGDLRGSVGSEGDGAGDFEASVGFCEVEGDCREIRVGGAARGDALSAAVLYGRRNDEITRVGVGDGDHLGAMV